MVVRRPTVARLDDEDVRAADRLAEAAVGLAVLEGLELDLAELDVQLIGDAMSELGIERPEKSMSLPDGPRSIQRPRSPLG